MEKTKQLISREALLSSAEYWERLGETELRDRYLDAAVRAETLNLDWVEDPATA